MLALVLHGAAAAAAVDLSGLWDVSDPVASERRLREALTHATGDDALIITTQIARTFQLRREFERARAVLADIAGPIESAGPEARTRYWLELGRTYVSHRHSPELVTEADRTHARDAFAEALRISKAARLDALSVDIVHMCAFVETDRSTQLRCNQEALQIVQASTQPDALRWEASVRSNLGESLFELGRYAEALAEFRQSADLYAAREDKPGNLDSRWHVARTLRMLNRMEEALAIQTTLEMEWASLGQSRRYVFEELELLHRAQGNLDAAQRYAKLAGPEVK